VFYHQAYADCLMLNLLSDIYPEWPGFSGGNTTLDTLAGDLPVVTCPGEFMRGRLSYAMPKMIGHDLKQLPQMRYIMLH